MKIDVIASTQSNYVAQKSEFDNLGGHTAGVCYMPGSYDDILNESTEKTERRIKQTKDSAHHSVYDHPSISLSISDIPKALAMLLNNEKMYTTSEKSARYTKMILKEDEKKLYDKWLEIYKKIIKEKYQSNFPLFFTDSKIEKLAQENARYLISVFTPTSMIYTTSYRQLNLIYSFLQKEINRENQNIFFTELIPPMKDLCAGLEKLDYIDEKLSQNEKHREQSLLKQGYTPKEYFGDVYATTYKGSFAELAQAQRHRTLSYNISLLDKNEFYIPPIIRENENLSQEWRKDCEKQAYVFPQGMLVNISEYGTLDNFILKMLERKCTFAQLEINQQTNDTLKKMIKGLKDINHKRATELEKGYTKGSRCTFPDYTCKTPCGFKDGVCEEREI
ncbi:MAG: hypothetical protein EOM55_03470 [Clostridia bacterium]|nr:hypothetical protein [Clostridia bacterium]